MQKSMSQKVHNYIKEHLRMKRWRRIVTAMACIVVFCTTYALILPAITMTDDAYCGKEEHTHSEECYERTPICGQTETAAHVHTEECYKTEPVLVCEQEGSIGHAHSESCYAEQSELTCGLAEDENHTHSDSCYTKTKTLICGQVESTGHTHDASCYQEEKELVCTESTEGHTHTDNCYEEKLVCTKEEHTHSLSCYSNPNADTEDASIWEETIPTDLGDNWAENVVAVAKSQLGYTESSANYTVLEDGVTMKGYTRYGAWYGDPYGDWCAMFASFCLHYAGVPETSVPYASGCTYWVEQLQDAGLYESAAECFPELGFLVFFDTDGDGLSNHVGIVTEVAEDGEIIGTVEGNTSGAVMTRSYSESDSTILGYCVLPQNPNMQEDETVSENDIMLTSEGSSESSFEFTDDDAGLTATLTLTSGNYLPTDYNLKVERQDQNGYENALKTFTAHGQEIAEAAIYKITLVSKETGQSFTNLNSDYTLNMKWGKGLFTEVNESDDLKYTYCKNSGSEPTEFDNCEVTKNDVGNVTSITVSGFYPNSAEFLLVRLKAADKLIAGQYKLVYNDVKDCFITDPAYAAYYNSNSPLGTAGSFHIVAFDTATLSAHTNGNILAKNLDAGSNFGTNNLTDELSYVQNYGQVNSVNAADDGDILVLGSSVKVEFADNGNAFSINDRKNDKPYNLVQDRNSETAPFIDLDRVKAEITQISETMCNFQDANLDYTSAQNLSKDNSRLYLRNSSAVGVVSYTATELQEKLGSYVQIDGFKKGYSGTVIINVDCTGVNTIDMPKATIVIDGEEQGTGEVTEFSAGKVIWNFVNASGVTINANLMTGTVIAPGATVNIRQNLNGTVVAENVNVKAESHRTDFTGKIEEPVEETETEPDAYYISVKKIKTGYTGTVLSEAEFDLYQWKDNGWTKVNDSPLTTGSSGTVMLSNLTSNVAYKLVETKAPDKYELSSVDTFFWIRTDAAQTNPTQMPEGFTGQALDAGSTLQIANNPSDEAYVSISVKKVWQDEKGNEMMTPEVESVTVVLYQDDIEIKKETLNSDNNWSYTWTELKTGHNYDVKEETVEGYTATYTTEADGTRVITNKKDSTYVLPETGGAGTTLFTIGGTLIMAGSLLCGYVLRRRQERRFTK